MSKRPDTCDIRSFQIKEESMVEDLNNILNAGEVPNLFALEDKIEICEKMRVIDRQRDKSMQVRATGWDGTTRDGTGRDGLRRRVAGLWAGGSFARLEERFRSGFRSRVSLLLYISFY